MRQRLAVLAALINVKQLSPAEEILAAIPTAEAAEKEAYADMEQRYGKQP